MLQAVELLYALGALNNKCQLVEPDGVRLAEMPLHPTFGKMLLAAVEMGCTEEMLTIAAMTQIQNVFLNVPNEKHKVVCLLHSINLHFTFNNLFVKSFQLVSSFIHYH